VRCASAGAERREGRLCADPAYVVIPQGEKKEKRKKGRSLFFLNGAALLQEAGGCHQCVVRVRERIAPNAGSARTLLMANMGLYV
jgi:hypothetical protein